MTPRSPHVAWLVLAGMLVSSVVAAQQPQQTPIRPVDDDILFPPFKLPEGSLQQTPIRPVDDDIPPLQLPTAAQQPQRTPIRLDPISESDIAYRYRLFETTNIWTFILLDTATGRVWQIQYSLDETPTARLVINGASLLPDGAKTKNGRFTLYRTHNMYNFLLLDREDSRIWQIQWSTEAKDRGIMRSIPAAK